MARTHKIIRRYIDRLIQIRKVIQPALIEEGADLASKLGPGTHRSKDYPGLLIRISRTTPEEAVDWRAVAYSLMRNFEIPAGRFETIKSNYTVTRFPNYRYKATITKDKAKKPKSLVA